MLKKLYLPKLAFQMKLKFYRYHIFIVMALGLFLNSCVSRQKVVYFENAQELNSSILAADATVRIKPNDAITIRVNAPEQAAAMPFNLTKSLAVGNNQPGNIELETYVVEQDSTIMFPELGRIKVGGYTNIELARKIEDQLRPYLKQPLVTVRIQNFQVSVLGEVGSPGPVITTNNQLSLPEALGGAGDLLITAKRNNILVARAEQGKMTYHYLDLTDANITSSPYYYLQQNDIVYVEPNAGQRQRAGILSTLSTYLGLASVAISLALIFTR